MKKTILLKVELKVAKRIFIGLLLACALIFPQHNAKGNVTLGTAGDFAVLAGASVVNTGLSVIDGGDVGVSPSASISGFPPGTIVAPSTMQAGTALAAEGQTDLATAYNAAAALAPTRNLTGQNLGGLTLTPGTYFFSSTAQLTGTLMLNDLGNPNAQFVFQIGSTLTTAGNSSVITIGSGSNPDLNVYWQVGSSATLGTATAFEGNILALTSITATTGATDLDGRLLAENGTVTLDANTITVPSAGVTVGVSDTVSTFLLFGTGLAALFAFGRRFST
jgi:hypothetical protein